MPVYVLLYNAGTDNEGIHTIQTPSGHTVLMFETEDDATRFALMLEAQDFPVPSICPIDAAEVKAFCAETGYDVRLIEAGDLQLPPESNVEQPDWDAESPTDIPRAETEVEGELNTKELDHIRRQLEKLL